MIAIAKRTNPSLTVSSAAKQNSFSPRSFGYMINSCFTFIFSVKTDLICDLLIKILCTQSKTNLGKKFVQFLINCMLLPEFHAAK